MAFKLTKSEEKDRADRTKSLRDEADKLQAAFAKYNNDIHDLNDVLQKAIDAYNEQLGEVRGFCEDIVSRIDAEFDERSEKWQEGDKAQAVSEWKDMWESVELEDIEITLHEEIEVPELDHAGEVDNLDVEPND